MSLKHKCFISYHHADQVEVDAFIKKFDHGDGCMIARAVGSMGQDIIDSTDSDYVMRKIRERYLTDSTVTIVMIGRCTWSRRYIDWEIASSLRNDSNNKRSGLMAITLPSRADKTKILPPRFEDNNFDWAKKAGYAKWWQYPTTADALAAYIEDAFESRTDLERIKHLKNSRGLFGYNRNC
jgi:hypothetical protein